MNRSMQTLSAAALAFALLAPAAWASQDTHVEHQKAQAANGQPINHGQMQNMDHSKMDHGAMHKDAKPKAESNDDR